MQLNAFSKLFSRLLIHRVFQRHQIGFLAVMARRSNAVRPLPVIGHQHQSGGVDIQSTCGMQLMRDRDIEEIENRWMIRIVRGANVPCGLLSIK
jgi:hypothetical protein